MTASHELRLNTLCHTHIKVSHTPLPTLPEPQCYLQHSDHSLVDHPCLNKEWAVTKEGKLACALTNLLVQKTAIKYGTEVGGVKTDDSLKVCCYGDAVLKLHPHTMQDLREGCGTVSGCG